MKCPKCDLENPDSSLYCDCGHTFPLISYGAEPQLESNDNKASWGALEKDEIECPKCGALVNFGKTMCVCGEFFPERAIKFQNYLRFKDAIGKDFREELLRRFPHRRDICAWCQKANPRDHMRCECRYNFSEHTAPDGTRLPGRVEYSKLSNAFTRKDQSLSAIVVGFLMGFGVGSLVAVLLR